MINISKGRNTSYPDLIIVPCASTLNYYTVPHQFRQLPYFNLHTIYEMKSAQWSPLQAKGLLQHTECSHSCTFPRISGSGSSHKGSPTVPGCHRGSAVGIHFTAVLAPSSPVKCVPSSEGLGNALSSLMFQADTGCTLA